ncbi:MULTISPECIES: ceramide glucosyltransferase [Thermodesulfovibrio]|uniref:Ceramide glucosyltransferase, putative n=1 Tax=Thermodesulfovibrio yellowstonii (strain ATCC 51303 / DSM 11347 / YP87) TaxID=289376 RepID=B5YH84_THEYD|nr:MULTISPECIES: ceramide glucosyltransferase [Thermodesulfovibrio]ACI21069.1 ceramide glucosyltransferase, putative [Thermodesulfovibrio yellowstonii DSM 11347]MDI6865591.1 ceramide glucosyltransferase [Thermodesulfovibrio yellowstonii]
MILWIVLFLVFMSLAVYALQVIALRRKLREEYAFINFPPISIIKPLKGLDDNLFDNLESFCKQDYPEYEVILSLQDYNDPAYRVAEKIRNKYPELVKVILNNSYSALNPKVKNMISAYKESKHDYFLISDSNVYVEPDYLKRTVSAMTHDTGLVTNLIMGAGGKTLGAKLENLQLNSFVIISVCFLDKFLKMPCSIGKSMLMRKSDFEEIGGFNAVKDVLAEDYMIGKLMHEKGKKVALCSYIIKNINEYWSLRRFLNRHTRWAKIRWKIAGSKYFIEPLSNPVFISSIMLILDGFSKNSITIFIAVVTIKIAFDLYINRLMKSSTGLSGILIPLKDFITGLIWFTPLISCKLNWRGNTYKIGKETKIIPYESNFLLKLIFNKLRTAITN